MTDVELGYNQAIYAKRQIVERVNMRVKLFRAFTDTWRHDHELHEISFILAYKLVNVFLEFEPMNRE